MVNSVKQQNPFTIKCRLNDCHERVIGIRIHFELLYIPMTRRSRDHDVSYFILPFMILENTLDDESNVIFH